MHACYTHALEASSQLPIDIFYRSELGIAIVTFDIDSTVQLPLMSITDRYVNEMIQL